MNIFKLLTKSGRRQLVREAIEDYLTPESIARLAAEAVARSLEAGAGKLTDARVAQIAVGCQNGGEFCAKLGKAVSPEGDGGKVVTEAEKAEIRASITVAANALVTQEFLDDMVNTVVSYVP